MSKDDAPSSWAGWFANWAARAPQRWFGKRSVVGQDLVGGTDGVKYLLNLARGNRSMQREKPHPVKTSGPPVLLIHGFMGTRGSMYPLEQRFHNDGFCVFSFNLGAINTRDVRASAFRIHQRIEAVLQQTAVDKIDIVGHSMGGLIGLYYVKKLGGHHRVRRLIMMGAPINGTWAALGGILTMGLWSASSWQLLPRSRFLDELRQGPVPKGVEVTTIAAVRDWVCPVPSTRLPGAKSIAVPMGHSSLVISAEVYQRIVSILRAKESVDSDEVAKRSEDLHG